MQASLRYPPSPVPGKARPASDAALPRENVPHCGKKRGTLTKRPQRTPNFFANDDERPIFSGFGEESRNYQSFCLIALFPLCTYLSFSPSLCVRISVGAYVVARANHPSLPPTSLSLGDRRRGCGLDPTLQRLVPQAQVMDAPARNSSYVGQRQGERARNCLFFFFRNPAPLHTLL